VHLAGSHENHGPQGHFDFERHIGGEIEGPLGATEEALTLRERSFTSRSIC
jgi:hypothetical protein